MAFAAGGIMRAAPAEASTIPMPPCHEMAMADAMHHAPADADHEDGQADHKSKPGAMATNCCVGCLPAGQKAVVGDMAALAATDIVFADLHAPLDGLEAAPEPRPPRA
ncbi:hypothetical protein P7A99_16205 [Caulobacter endophyticus]|nr:hypothetical protein [Caulobacter endophyticus]